MIEFVVEILGELLIQIVGEVLIEFGLHSIAEPFRKKPNPWVAAVGFLLIGSVVGGISLMVFPDHFVTNPTWRLLNLGISPMTAGAVMALMGAWRRRRGEEVLRIDRFAYGYLFALSLGLVRFYFCN